MLKKVMKILEKCKINDIKLMKWISLIKSKQYHLFERLLVEI
ncbi:hypothetical protein BCBMB205_39110 [Bacillus sp. CN2]|nr:hypothetical protein BCBMB205_39110 [Bacillus velezensis]ARZ60257.1 hypothetical protein BAGQ_4053 [Bacillus velezensis]GFR55336.1 hypothetical protein BCBMB205_39110 [Bacillus sp. CN2]